MPLGEIPALWDRWVCVCVCVWRLGLVTCALRGVIHNIVRGYRHPARTAFSDTVIIAVCPS